MAMKPHFFHIVVSSVLVLFIIECELSVGELFPRTKVKITNNLESESDLEVHCKSKDDDLGSHTLPLVDTYEFDFRPNFFMTTLFFCAFRWGPDYEIHHFDIYDAQNLSTSDCNNCVWRVYSDGPCRFVGEGCYICFVWNNV